MERTSSSSGLFLRTHYRGLIDAVDQNLSWLTSTVVISRTLRSTLRSTSQKHFREREPFLYRQMLRLFQTYTMMIIDIQSMNIPIPIAWYWYGGQQMASGLPEESGFQLPVHDESSFLSFLKSQPLIFERYRRVSQLFDVMHFSTVSDRDAVSGNTDDIDVWDVILQMDLVVQEYNQSHGPQTNVHPPHSFFPIYEMNTDGNRFYYFLDCNFHVISPLDMACGWFYRYWNRDEVSRQFFDLFRPFSIEQLVQEVIGDMPDSDRKQQYKQDVERLFGNYRELRNLITHVAVPDTHQDKMMQSVKQWENTLSEQKTNLIGLLLKEKKRYHQVFWKAWCTRVLNIIDDIESTRETYSHWKFLFDHYPIIIPILVNMVIVNLITGSDSWSDLRNRDYWKSSSHPSRVLNWNSWLYR